jgi:hypothetical protein
MLATDAQGGLMEEVSLENEIPFHGGTCQIFRDESCFGRLVNLWSNLKT